MAYDQIGLALDDCKCTGEISLNQRTRLEALSRSEHSLLLFEITLYVQNASIFPFWEITAPKPFSDASHCRGALH